MDKLYSCEWEPIHVCNYRCPYCPYPWHSPELALRHKECTTEDWISFWQRIFERYGEFLIRVSGGEPSLHGGFIRMMAAISRHHRMEIITNLSWDVERAAGVKPKNIKFVGSYHPHFVALETFRKKILSLKEMGFEVLVRVVGYPPIMKDIPKIHEEFASVGVTVRDNSFFGEYNGRVYPESYTDDDRAWLNAKAVVQKKPYKMNLGLESPQGRLCETGVRYMRLYPDGEAYRCARVQVSIGNIKDKNFQLLKEAAPCPVEHCYCDAEHFYLKDVDQDAFYKKAASA